MGRIARHVHRMAVVCVRKCGPLSSYMQELAKKQNVVFPDAGVHPRPTPPHTRTSQHNHNALTTHVHYLVVMRSLSTMKAEL